MGEPESAVDPRVAPLCFRSRSARRPAVLSQPVRASPRSFRRPSPSPRPGDRADGLAEPVADRRGRFGRFGLVEEGTLGPHFVGAVKPEPGELSAAQGTAIVDEDDGKARFLGPANCARGTPGKLVADSTAHADAQVRALGPPFERGMDDVADGNDPPPDGLEAEREAPSRTGMGASGRKPSACKILPGVAFAARTSRSAASPMRRSASWARRPSSPSRIHARARPDIPMRRCRPPTTTLRQTVPRAARASATSPARSATSADSATSGFSDVFPKPAAPPARLDSPARLEPSSCPAPRHACAIAPIMPTPRSPIPPGTPRATTISSTPRPSAHAMSSPSAVESPPKGPGSDSIQSKAIFL